MHHLIAYRCLLQHQGSLKGILKNMRGFMIKGGDYMQVKREVSEFSHQGLGLTILSYMELFLMVGFQQGNAVEIILFGHFCRWCLLTLLLSRIPVLCHYVYFSQNRVPRDVQTLLHSFR